MLVLSIVQFCQGIFTIHFSFRTLDIQYQNKTRFFFNYRPILKDSFNRTRINPNNKIVHRITDISRISRTAGPEKIETEPKSTQGGPHSIRHRHSHRISYTRQTSRILVAIQWPDLGPYPPERSITVAALIQRYANHI